MVGRVESSQDDLTPREAEGPRGDKTRGALTASRYRQGEEGRGRGRGDENPPTAQATRGQGLDGGDGAARLDKTEAPEEAMETAAGAGGAENPPKHFDVADSATTENGKHLHCEYNKVASEASERGQARVGPVIGEDGHGATTHSAVQTREEEGDKNPRRTSSAQEETDSRETEERGLPKWSRAPNASGLRGGDWGGGTPTQ